MLRKIVNPKNFEDLSKRGENTVSKIWFRAK
jgi:hypothetical protein